MARDIGITTVARLFSALGNGGVLSLLCVALTIAGFALKKENLRDAGWKSLTALIFATILLHILKAAFERPRMAHLDGALLYLLENPSIFDLTGRYNSFPSGHTMVTFTVAATLAFYYPRMAIILYPLAALVGLSRVYLGSHYPSDVVAGAFLGIGFTYLLTRNIIVERWRECLLLTAAVIMAYFKLGGFILFDVDEAVFSEATREMVTGGDYITPMYNSLPRYDKPILFYWLMSMAFGLFGVSEFAARFT
jgi:undecaprenyl-diphosphatase